MRILAHQTSYDEQGDLPELLTRATDRVVAAVQASPVPVDLVVLPELWAVGAFRPRRWEAAAEGLDGPTVTAMAALARELGSVVHLGSIIERDGGDLYNTAVVLGADGDVLATYRKIHLFRAGGMEAEILTAGDEVVTVDLPLRDGSTLRAGLATCYDLRFPELFRAHVDAGAQAHLVPASWPTARAPMWDVLTRARAGENQTLLVGAAATGTDGKTPMTGRSVVVGPTGDDLTRSTTRGADVLDVEVDLGIIREARTSFPVLLDRRIDVAAAPHLAG